MPDPVHAAEHPHEPAHRYSPVDPVVTGSKRAHLFARDHAFLLSGEAHDAPLHSTWAAFSSHMEE
jgi:hypothetical protein